MSSDNDAGLSDEIDFRRLLQSTWASRKWIALFSALFMFMAAFYLANTPPTFEADALLQLEERAGQMGLPASMTDFVDSSPRVATEVEIITSRLVISQVVGELNLDWVAEPVRAPLIGNALMRYALPFPKSGFFAQYGRVGDSIEIALLEVPPDWVSDDMFLTARDDGKFDLVLPDGTEMSGEVGQMLRNPVRGFALQVKQLKAASGRKFLLRHMNERQAIERVRSKLRVVESGRQSSILDITYTDTDVTRATKVLAEITNAYVRQNIDRSAAVAESSLAFIEGQLPKAKTNLEVAENALNNYRQSQKSVDLDFETSNVLSQITRIETDLRELQTKEDDIKQRYKTTHPIYQQLLAQRARLNESLAEARKQVDALPETQREVLNLSSNLELTRQIYTELQTRAQEVRVLRASTVGNVRIVDDAQPGIRAVSPSRSRFLAVALIMGAFFGTAFGLLKIWLRRTIQGTEALEQMGLPVFATINLAKTSSGLGRNRQVGTILAISDPTDLSVEGLRSLRTSLQFGMLDAKSRSLGITSTAPGAGKSFTSANLGVVSAQAGQKVCLIDADLRRGQLRKMFNVAKGEAGLSEYLAGEKTLDEVLRKTDVDGLMFIASGRYPPNPSELLMRKNMEDLIAELDARFDMSIFDCPPVLAVTDPVIVGRVTGGTLAVVRYDETPTAEVQAMVKTFDSAGIKLTGTILNGFDPRKARAGGYSYNYNYRYEYKTRTKEKD